MVLSFVGFCVLATGLPLGLRWFILHSQVQRSALLRVISGTVLVVPTADSDPIALQDQRTVDGGTVIKTDARSQAVLTLAVDAKEGAEKTASVQIYPGAEITLTHATRPRFRWSSDPVHLTLNVRSGRVRLDLSPAAPNGQRVTVTTPHGTSTLQPGSYGVQVNGDQTQVAVRDGEAVVESGGRAVLLEHGVSSTIVAGQGPGAPRLAAEDLILDGDFDQPLVPPQWLVAKYPADDPSAGQTEILTVDGRAAVRLSRINQPATHTEVSITQVLGKDVHDYESLVLQMDVLLRWQSLPGAGEQSSEFPLMFRLDYEDIYGNHQFWTHGFYYQNPPPQWVVTGGEKIPQNVWFPFESGNLIDVLQEQGLPPPATLNYLKIYASGHNYDSLVSGVGLIAR